VKKDQQAKKKSAPSGMQVNKYIAASGFCSRREADKLIEQFRVSINNELVELGARVQEGDVVAVDGEKIKLKQKQAIYIALNKPVGVTSTTDPTDKTNIIYFVNHPKRIFPVGRLDKDSEGLILLTNDGDIVNKILRAGNEHEKEYVVSVDKAITGDFYGRMAKGIPMLGTVTQPCKIWPAGSHRFKIILTQGLNRQIRRMCETLGYKVTSLKRVRIMHIHLDNLPVGKWRYLLPDEIEKLHNSSAGSVKTEEASLHKKTKQRGNKKSQKKNKYL
jgi:23S rRNA pseudouridine2604 synthase